MYYLLINDLQTYTEKNEQEKEKIAEVVDNWINNASKAIMDFEKGISEGNLTKRHEEIIGDWLRKKKEF